LGLLLLYEWHNLSRALIRVSIERKSEGDLFMEHNEEE
jgi:hypothetical protein